MHSALQHPLIRADRRGTRAAQEQLRQKEKQQGIAVVEQSTACTVAHWHHQNSSWTWENIKEECFAFWGHPRAVSFLTRRSEWHGHPSLAREGSALSFHRNFCWLEPMCILSPRLHRFILYFCNSTKELYAPGFFAATLFLGHYLLKHDQFGADGSKGSWVPIHCHQCRANLVLWVPFFQKQPPTDGNSAECTFVNEEVLQPPHFHTQPLPCGQDRLSRSQTKTYNGPPYQAAQDTARSLLNATWIQAFIHHATLSQGGLQVTTK